RRWRGCGWADSSRSRARPNASPSRTRPACQPAIGLPFARGLFADLGQQAVTHHVVADIDGRRVTLGVGATMALDDDAIEAEEDGTVGFARIHLLAQRLESRACQQITEPRRPGAVHGAAQILGELARGAFRGRHRAPVRPIFAQRHEPHLDGAARLSAGTLGFPGAAREDGSAQIQRCRPPRPQWHRHQEPWWRRHRGLRGGHRYRLRHGALRPAGQDRRTGRARTGGQWPAGKRGGFVTVKRSVVLGCGSYLPSHILSNDDLARSVATTDEWIVQRTGIRERHIAAPGELTSDLALAAARAALSNARLEPSEIDLIVLATSTPDQTFPATAVSVQAGLGITRGAAFDLQAVCSGFIFALSVVDGLLRTGVHKRALVIGAETFSRILDWSDRTTCVLFGDGA